MAVTLIYEDLLADISKPELDGLAKQLLESGQPDPVDTAIAEALSTIGMYVDPYLLKDDALRKLWRLLTIIWIYNRLSALPKKRQDERDWVLKVLEGVRDGKFPNMLIDPVVAAELAGSSWGSQRRQNVGAATAVRCADPTDASWSDDE